MPPEVLKAAESDRHFVVQFRKSRRFLEVEVPTWAQRIADDIAAGATVRMGELGTGHVVESVLLPRDRALDVDEAASIAAQIVQEVEG